MLKIENKKQNIVAFSKKAVRTCVFCIKISKLIQELHLTLHKTFKAQTPCTWLSLRKKFSLLKQHIYPKRCYFAQFHIFWKNVHLNEL